MTSLPTTSAAPRQGYFANISYIDDKIGEMLAVLEATRQEPDVVSSCPTTARCWAEKGLWFKMNFFEGSARVPLMISAPGMPAGLVDTPVSTIDLAPTLCDLAGISMEEVAPWTDGVNLCRWPNGAPAHQPRGDGICRRRHHHPDGRPARRRLEIHPLPRRSRTAVRPGQRPAGDARTSPPIPAPPKSWHFRALADAALGPARL